MKQRPCVICQKPHSRRKKTCGDICWKKNESDVQRRANKNYRAKVKAIPWFEKIEMEEDALEDASTRRQPYLVEMARRWSY